MPRIAQTLDSKNEMQGEDDGQVQGEEGSEGDSEEEGIELEGQTLAYLNNNDCSVVCAAESFEIVPSRTPDSSQNSSCLNPYDDSDDENSPLRVMIGGMVKKFKKDSRVWLHKSSAKIKKGNTVTDESKTQILDDRGDSQIRIEVSRAEAMDVEDVADCDTVPCNQKGLNNSESNVSVVGDSDADLSYSEEEPEESAYSTIPCQNSLAFYKHDDECGQEVEVEAMETDIMPNDDLVTTDQVKPDVKRKASDEISSGNVAFCNHGNVSPASLSKSTEKEIAFKRWAPAIAQEDESLKESLLDYAVNHFGKQQSGTRKILSGRVFKRAKRKVSAFAAHAQRKEGIASPTRLPSCMCASTRVTRQRQEYMAERDECLKHFNRCLASLSSTHSDESRDSLTHTPSLDAALATVPRQVPSLLLMAASALNLGGGKKTAELNGFEMKDNMEDRPK